jgi:hypothetical protein
MMGTEIEYRASAHSLFTKDQIACCNSFMLSIEGSFLAVFNQHPKLTKDQHEL